MSTEWTPWHDQAMFFMCTAPGPRKRRRDAHGLVKRWSVEKCKKYLRNEGRILSRLGKLQSILKNLTSVELYRGYTNERNEHT